MEFQRFPLKFHTKYLTHTHLYLDVKIWELLDVRAQKCFWNAPQVAGHPIDPKLAMFSSVGVQFLSAMYFEFIASVSLNNLGRLVLVLLFITVSSIFNHDVLKSDLCSFLYPPLQRSWKGGILVSPCPSVRPFVRPSVRPSVDKIVSALYLQQYSWDPFRICTSYQATKEGVSRLTLVEILANFLNL